MIKGRFFRKKDELILSIIMIFIVSGLIYQGVFALCYSSTSHAIFQKDISHMARH